MQPKSPAFTPFFSVRSVGPIGQTLQYREPQWMLSKPHGNLIAGACSGGLSSLLLRPPDLRLRYCSRNEFIRVSSGCPSPTLGQTVRRGVPGQNCTGKEGRALGFTVRCCPRPGRTPDSHPNVTFSSHQRSHCVPITHSLPASDPGSLKAILKTFNPLTVFTQAHGIKVQKAFQPRLRKQTVYTLSSCVTVVNKAHRSKHW